MRLQLNNFVSNKRLYERKYHYAGFIIKKKFSDSSAEDIAVIRYSGNDNFEVMHNKLDKIINNAKSDEASANNDLAFVEKFPNFVFRMIFPVLRFLDRHGKLPSSLMNSDPNYCTLFVTNLGSIGLDSGYHHLNEWGTNSLFCVIGEKKMRPFYSDDGTYVMKNSIKFGLVVDERIADGYYFAKSIKLVKFLFEHPEELDKDFNEAVDYEQS